jgi:hypothetical protein
MGLFFTKGNFQKLILKQAVYKVSSFKAKAKISTVYFIFEKGILPIGYNFQSL